jgi:hypothetical protein
VKKKTKKPKVVHHDVVTKYDYTKTIPAPPGWVQVLALMDHEGDEPTDYAVTDIAAFVHATVTIKENGRVVRTRQEYEPLVEVPGGYALASASEAYDDDFGWLDAGIVGPTHEAREHFIREKIARLELSDDEGFNLAWALGLPRDDDEPAQSDNKPALAVVPNAKAEG